MKITPDLFLAKLAADPKIAAEFDSIHPGLTRRDHVVRTLNLVENTIAYNKAAKQKLIAARARIVALERATASMPAPKAVSTRSKPTAAKAPASAGPYAAERTDILVVALRKKYVTGKQAELVAGELARRGVSLSKP